MGGGSWKVAYADFVTAMMAFFLLMWILNMAPKETKEGLAGYFQLAGATDTTQSSPVANNPLTQNITRIDTREFKLSEVEKSHYAIAQELKQFLMADSKLSSSNGIVSTNVGVLLHVTDDALFRDNSVELSEEGRKVLDEVIGVMRKYKVFLVVRGHTAAGETGAPAYPSKWELSAARADAAVRYIAERGIDTSLIRSVAYADTRPLADPADPDAAAKNRRVEFYFHRPEIMSTMVGY